MGETRAPSRIFFSKILSSLTSLVVGTDSIAPSVFSLAASAHRSCSWYLGIKASGGTSSLSSVRTNKNNNFSVQLFLSNIFKQKTYQDRRSDLNHQCSQRFDLWSCWTADMCLSPSVLQCSASPRLEPSSFQLFALSAWGIQSAKNLKESRKLFKIFYK